MHHRPLQQMFLKLSFSIKFL
ncbi:hypothetical protein Nmel_015142 [Mimus melanotis]